jgi:hypothetical protein
MRDATAFQPAPSILFSLQATTGSKAQALTHKVEAGAPPLGMDGVLASLGWLHGKITSAIIRGMEWLLTKRPGVLLTFDN